MKFLKKYQVYSLVTLNNLILYNINFFTGQICIEKCSSVWFLSWMTSLKVWMIARGKIVNQLLYINFCDLTG